MAATLLFVLFVVYLYTPYLLFKFFVEENIDLDRRKDVTRIEEFFAAALPSAVLNGVTWAAFHVFWFLKLPPVDWAVAASLFDPQLTAFRKHVASAPSGELKYILGLFVSSAVSGYLYGLVEARLLQRQAEVSFFRRESMTRRRVAWTVALMYRRVWLLFFAGVASRTNPWSARDTWMFVRTTSDRLYYGLFFEHTNDADGELDTISLIKTQRYTTGSATDRLRSGRNPLTRLGGTFVLKWREVADLNVVSPDVMAAVRTGYAQKLRTWRRNKKKRSRRATLFARTIRKGRLLKR